MQGEAAGTAVPSLQLQGLQVRLGPELRAMYPVVVNLGISGGVELNGPADPKQLRLNGVIDLDSGEVSNARRAPSPIFTVITVMLFDLVWTGSHIKGRYDSRLHGATKHQQMYDPSLLASEPKGEWSI